MYLEDAIARLLRSDHVAGIDFDLNGLHITGAGLGRIADLVADGHIRVHVDPGLCAAASYDPRHNIINLPTRRLSDTIVTLSVVHEAVHALCDRARALGGVYVEESAAYLAEAIYARRADLSESVWSEQARERPPYCGEHEDAMRRAINEHRRAVGRERRSRHRPINDRAVDRIMRAARDLIRQFRLDQDVQQRRPLNWDQFSALRDAVASAGSYEFAQLPDAPGGPPNRYENDGIRRRPHAHPAHIYLAR